MLRVAGVGGDVEVFLWPDCIPAWDCWCAVQTQWRSGMAGATGLDYAGVHALLQLRLADPAQRAEVFECICAAEQATLAEWARQREQQART